MGAGIGFGSDDKGSVRDDDAGDGCCWDFVLTSGKKGIWIMRSSVSEWQKGCESE